MLDGPSEGGWVHHGPLHGTVLNPNINRLLRCLTCNYLWPKRRQIRPASHSDKGKKHEKEDTYCCACLPRCGKRSRLLRAARRSWHLFFSGLPSVPCCNHKLAAAREFHWIATVSRRQEPPKVSASSCEKLFKWHTSPITCELERPRCSRVQRKSGMTRRTAAS